MLFEKVNKLSLGQTHDLMAFILDCNAYTMNTVIHIKICHGALLNYEFYHCHILMAV